MHPHDTAEAQRQVQMAGAARIARKETVPKARSGRRAGGQPKPWSSQRSKGFSRRGRLEGGWVFAAGRSQLSRPSSPAPWRRGCLRGRWATRTVLDAGGGYTPNGACQPRSEQRCTGVLGNRDHTFFDDTVAFDAERHMCWPLSRSSGGVLMEDTKLSIYPSRAVSLKGTRDIRACFTARLQHDELAAQCVWNDVFVAKVGSCAAVDATANTWKRLAGAYSCCHGSKIPITTAQLR